MGNLAQQRYREHLYAVILAGGVGSRLWPRSRYASPKQFLDLTGRGTMLQEAYVRIAPIIAGDHTMVVTNARYLPTVRRQLAVLPPQNLIGEPVGRNSAPAIGLAATYLARQDPDAIMAVLTADHLIERAEQFRQAILAAATLAEEDYIVTLGIQPAGPEVGFGYIERGEPLGEWDDFQAERVVRFTEKPNAEMARQFVQSGKYAWNSGMFIWKIGRVLQEFQRQMPELYRQLQEIASAFDTPDEEEIFHRVWLDIEKQSIDFGIMEHAQDVVVIPVNIGWSDIGSWATLYDALPKDDQGNIVQAQHFGLDTAGSFVYSDIPERLIATVGVHDLVIVDTTDALLVMPRGEAQRVREVVQRLEKAHRPEFL